jgi:hypothetical protein
MCDDDDDDNVLTWLARTNVFFWGLISPNFNLKNMISTYTVKRKGTQLVILTLVYML